MTFSDSCSTLDGLADNVVAFPGAHRTQVGTAASNTLRALPHGVRPSAATGVEINARLLILLGICTTGAAVVLSAAHILLAS